MLGLLETSLDDQVVGVVKSGGLGLRAKGVGLMPWVRIGLD